MRRLVLVVAAIVAFAGWPVSVAAGDTPTSIPKGLQTSAFRAATQGPIVATGTVRDNAGLAAAGWVALLAWPSSDMMHSIHDGDTVTIPTVGWARVAPNGHYVVRLAPGRLPDGFLSKTGQVNLDILSWNGTEMGHRFVSVQSGTPDRALLSSLASVAEPPEVDFALNQSLSATVDVATPDSGACTDNRIGTYRVWTRVADTWPYLYTTTGWVDIADSHSETVGVAATLGGVWTENGSATTDTGYDWVSPASTYYRGYDIEEQYGKWYYSCTFQTIFYVDYPTGGVNYYSVAYQPLWNRNYCAYVAGGTWTRNLANYNKFSLSGGVKSSSLIGINLSVNTDYSSTSGLQKKTIYSFGSHSSYLCGDNAVPSHAGHITDNGPTAP